MGTGKLGLASEEGLLKHLGIYTGSVSLLALINDAGHEVTLYVDEKLTSHERLLVHPLRNDCTLSLTWNDISLFLESMGRSLSVLKLPMLEVPELESGRQEV